MPRKLVASRTESNPQTRATTSPPPAPKSRLGAAVGFTFQPSQDQLFPLPPLPGKRSEKFPILGQIRDIAGTLRDVREIRPTKHGFDMYYGTPSSRRGASPGGKPHLIASIGLMEFWHENGTRGRGFLFDLPAGYSTLKSLRARLGFNFRDDTDAFWNARIGDLMSLSTTQFASRHDVTASAAAHWRYKIFGSITRPKGWWNTRKVVAVLVSGQRLAIIGKKLGISTSHAFRLRAQARRQIREGNNRVNPKLVSFRTFLKTPPTGASQPPLAA